MTKRKVMLRTPKDVTPVSLINSLTCFFAALNQIGATSPNSFLPHYVFRTVSYVQITVELYLNFSNDTKYLLTRWLFISWANSHVD